MDFYLTAIHLLMKLRRKLTRLRKKEPKRLKKRVIACTSKCDEILQKIRIEKAQVSRELESRDVDMETLKSEVEFYRSLMRIKGMHGISYITLKLMNRPNITIGSDICGALP